MTHADPRRHAPATARNREPLLNVLSRALPKSGLVLEVASGTGEHAIYFASMLPQITWQPSDPSADARSSIAAWREAEAAESVLAPLDLDASAASWPVENADAVLCINMIHISPWDSTVGLMRGAGGILAPGTPLVLYGPYRRRDRPLEPSNEAFDADLRRRDSRWGLRYLDDVAACADEYGFALESVVEMPANNLTVIFRKR